MRLGIMQPYFFPYIGYFQLMNQVDKFVVYDNIQYTRKSWINRNRILVNGGDQYITLPLKKDSDYLNINQRFLTDDFEDERKRILNRIKGSYSKAPYFKDAFVIISEIMNFNERNLFDYVFNSLVQLKEYLGIDTEIVKSSSLGSTEHYKAEEKVIRICKMMNATVYINPAGGLDLYSRQHFKDVDVELLFTKSNDISYKQLGEEFIPWLSIIDVLMFNSTETIKAMLNCYEEV